MKKRLSATIEKDAERMLNELAKDKDFRNKSHVIEKAIRLLWEESKNDKEIS